MPETKQVSVIEPEHLLCPITQIMFRDPVMAASGNTYERAAVLAHWKFRRQPHDPLTNEKLPNGMLITNWGKRREVRDFLEERIDYVPSGWMDREVPLAAEKNKWVAPRIPRIPFRIRLRELNSLFLTSATGVVMTCIAFVVLLLAIMVANPVVLTNLAQLSPWLQRAASVSVGPRFPRWEFSVAVFQAAGFQSILAAMSAHPEHADLQGNACVALSNLADDAEVRESILRAGGVKFIASALEFHPKDAYVQAGGCGALWSFAMNNAARLAISEAGGLKQVLQAMRHHPGDHYVQAEACGALWGLASNFENRAFIEKEGGLESVLAAMKDHLGREMVQRQGCGVLGHLASSSRNRYSIAQAGGLELIVAAMQKHPKDSWVQRNACGVFMHFRSDPEVDIPTILSDAGLKCSDFW